MTRSPAAAPPEAATDFERKAAALEERIATLNSVIVAYSGGVDSALIAVTATRLLGARALCITADSPSYPQRHRDLALGVVGAFHLHHEFIETAEMDRPEYRANAGDRCYYCKNELYTKLTGVARARGFAAVVDGSNADDRGDYRPGRQAAREFGVVSPLDEAGLTKAEVRELARRAGLSIWDEPASACLSSRIPYHTEVTREKLRTVEQAERVLRDLGFRVFRVRHHDTVARIEIGRDEIPRVLAPEVADAIDVSLRALGYQHVAVDLRGYRLGSLNDALRLRPVS
ncbi:MAG TPA: ATP-dependent sacrificial sulfur transferase LarE [Vicinamibacterales bacterium]|nr:ATP-dependent sacrificial sulfur transferase LarE [Vicinamibacterales bacterium]